MKLATKEEPRSETPDPVLILGRLESLVSSGINIGMVSGRSGIDESMLHTLLNDDDRESLGSRDRMRIDGRRGYQGQVLERAGYADKEYLSRLDAWLKSYDAERQQQAAREYTEIETGQYIAGLAVEAMEKKRLFHLIGGYGISKTKTMTRFCSQRPMTHETPGAVLVTLTTEEKTTTQFYQRVSDAMRINEKFQTRGRSIGQRVRNELRAGDMLVFDEANLAFENGLWSAIKDIYDGTRASIMMLSNPTSNGFVRINQDELGAFLSRCRTHPIDGNVPADGEVYAKALGYTCRSIIEEAGRIVTKRGPSGGMRAVAKAFEDAEQIAIRKGVQLNVALLRQAAKTNSVFFK